LAERKYTDDIPEDTKSRRLQEIVDMQRNLSRKSNEKDLNKMHRVLIEGESKKSDAHYSGRNSQNKVVVFPKSNHKPGEYVDVWVTECTAATLLGKTL
jgi:tRNA-2-methylthio-N6-dimethylallyladenosine synthase